MTARTPLWALMIGAVLCSGVMMPHAALATDYYTDAVYGNDANNGLSWATAKATITAALALATAPDCTIHVAQGYYPARLTISVAGTTLLGGYPNGGGERNPLALTDIHGAGGSAVTIGAIAGAQLDGFTIRGGSAASGAGLNINGATDAEIVNCTIRQNTASSSGGAALVQNGSATFTYCQFISNTASGGMGGGIYAVSAAVTLTNCVLDGNITSAANAYGGALYVNAASSAEIDGCTFSYNIINTTGTGTPASAFGGAIYALGALTVSSTTFDTNEARATYTGTSAGRYRYSYGGAICLATGSSLSGTDNTFIDNRAITDMTTSSTYGYANAYGGAVYGEGTASIADSGGTYRNNTAFARVTTTHSSSRAYVYGGTIAYAGASQLSLGLGTSIQTGIAQAFTYSSAQAYSRSGGVYVSNAAATVTLNGAVIRSCDTSATPANGRYGAGLFLENAGCAINNCIVADNFGDGFYLTGTAPAIRNCTIAYNRGTGILAAGGTVAASNCIVWGNSTDLYNVSATFCNVLEGALGEGNLDPPCNPLFLGNGDYHLYPESCCVDRGTFDNIVAYDIDGDPRPYYGGTRVDIGADETDGNHPTPTAYVTPPAEPTPGPGTPSPAPTQIPANDFYVDGLLGHDDNSGVSWDLAKASIPAGLALARDAGGGNVHVATGTYACKAVLASGARLLGGYPHGGGVRDPQANPCIIDGQGTEGTVSFGSVSDAEVDGFTIRNGRGGLGAGVSVTGAARIRIANNIITDNVCYANPILLNRALGGGLHVEGTDILIEGNTIRNNMVTGSEGFGGGIYCAGGFRIVLRGNTVELNSAPAGGGGIAVAGRGGPVLIDGNTIRYNQSTNLAGLSAPGGGGLRILPGAAAQVVDNTFANNSARALSGTTQIAAGGAIYTSGALELTDNSFVSNTAQADLVSATNAYGGAMYCASGSVVTASGNGFSTNQAVAYSAAFGGALYCAAGSQAALEETLFAGNQAVSSAGNGYGGAVHAADQSQLTLGLGTLIDQNLASGIASRAYGGGMSLQGTACAALLDGVIFKRNIALAANAAYSLGDGIYIDQTPASVINCFFCQHDGEAVYSANASITVTNCTMADNQTGIFASGAAAPSVSNCILWGNEDDLQNVMVTYSNVQEGADGVGNINPPCNPQFLTPGDYHLAPTSPCIDRGSFLTAPDHDADGQIRPFSSTLPDMGADETQSVNPTSTPTATGSATATPAASPTLTPTPAGSQFYVDALSGDDGNSGLSWAAAKATIGAALALAAAGGGTVHVAAGTYGETVTLSSHIRLWGGYPAGGGTREPAVNLTIIDGGGIDAVIRIGNTEDVQVDGFTITNGRSGLGAGITISQGRSVHITNNQIVNNTGVGSPALLNNALGGGLYVAGDDIDIAGNVIANNTVNGTLGAGGGVYCAGGGRIFIRNNAVNNNQAQHYGGGMFVAGGAAVVLSGNTFTGNICYCISTGGGGGLAVGAGATATAADNTFDSNLALWLNTLNGAAYGGAVYCLGGLTLTDNTFRQNRAHACYTLSYTSTNTQTTYGGAIYCGSGGAVTATGNTFEGNRAYTENLNPTAGYATHAHAYGGAVHCAAGGAVTSGGDLYQQNIAYSRATSAGRAYGYGGAISCANGGQLRLGLGTVIRQNQCQQQGNSYGYAYGGGVYIIGATAVAELDGVEIRGNILLSTPDNVSNGDGVYIDSAAARFDNCFIVENMADGVYLQASSSMFINNTIAANRGAGINCASGTPVIRNCILWGNTDDLVNATATYSDIQGGDPGQGNLNPPCNPNFIGGGDYHIRPESCCIDRGSVLGIKIYDVDGDVRPWNGGLVDIGADEAPGSNPTPTPYATPPGGVTPTPQPTPAFDFYVDGVFGSDENDGLSWASAKKTIATAVSLAQAAGEATVHVASAVYAENLTLCANLRLLGGYPPGGGPRAPATNTTVIDGSGIISAIQIGRLSNVEVNGFTIRNGRGGFGGGIVVTEGFNVRIIGNTITGNACYQSPLANTALGGGLYLHGTGIEVSGNTISGNSVDGPEGWGGGIYCASGQNLVISGNVIDGNSAAAGGGGIAVAGPGEAVLIEDNQLTNNQCPNVTGGSWPGGGALRVLASGAALVLDNTFLGNSALAPSGTMTEARGGAVFCSGQLIAEGNTFLDNIAQSRAAANYYAYGGALFCAGGGVMNLAGNTYTSNWASAYQDAHGGAIYCEGNGEVTAEDESFISNRAVSSNALAYGGAISCINGARLTIGLGARFELNQASATASYARGGAVSVTGSSTAAFVDGADIRRNLASGTNATYSHGWGLFVDSAPATVQNTIVVLHNGAGIYLNNSSAQFINCTIADNQGYGIRLTGTGNPLAQNCIVWGHANDLDLVSAIYSNVMEGAAGPGNINPPCDPLFVGGGDYHILPQSGCVDRGLSTNSPDHDWDGDARPFNNLIVDIGADETNGTNPTPGPSPTATPTPAGTPPATETATPAPDPLYVDQLNGSDLNDGLSWATAKASISAALAAAAPGSVIHVAAATYRENISVPCGATVLGGYPPGGGAREPGSNNTVIDGGSAAATVSLSTVQDVTLDGLSIINGRAQRGGGIYAYHSQRIALINLTVAANTAGSAGASNFGGGACFSGCDDVALQNCRFNGNQVQGATAAGGGALCLDDTLVVTVADCSFSGNIAARDGGAVFIAGGGSTIEFSDTSFSNNLATASSNRTNCGGAVYIAADSAPRFIGNTFTGNQAIMGTADTSAYLYGGAIYAAGSAVLEHNVFQDNQARFYFSGSYTAASTTYAYGGAVYCASGAVVVSSGNTYLSNRAHVEFLNSASSIATRSYGYGGAIYAAGGSQFTSMWDSLAQNSAYGRATSTGYGYSYGGAVFCQAAARASIGPGAYLVRNTAQSTGSYGYAYGGAVYAEAVTALTVNRARIDNNDALATPASQVYGDGIYLLADAPVVITNTFIVNNVGHGIYAATGGPGVQIVNNTLANNSTYGIYRNAGTLTAVNCILWNNGDDLYQTTATYSDIEDGDSGTGNISVNPQFAAGSFYLAPSSPCIDAGLNVAGPPEAEQDFDGETRPAGARFDIGADEQSAPPQLALTVLLDGFYSGGTQVPATVDLQLRAGGAPGAATAVVASLTGVAVDATGQTGTLEMTGWPNGSYYLVVSHLNHVQVITSRPVLFQSGAVTAVNLADPGSPDYVPCYGSEPLKTESLGELSLRGGNANGDRYVNATGDFALWLLANGSVPGAGNWDARADFNGNLAINSADFSVWLAQNGRVSYVLPAAAAAAAANGTRSGELRLRFRDAADGRLEADVVVTLPAQRRLIAVDAAVTYDLTSLSQPELVADHVAAGMTDFSLGSAAPDLTGAYHYSRGALPGQSGALLPAGETALYTLRFQRLDPSSDAAPRIAFASGFADIVTQPAPGRLPARVRAATE